jgi:hypothetical protein
MVMAASPAADALPSTCVTSSPKTKEVRTDGASRHRIPRTACMYSVQLKPGVLAPRGRSDHDAPFGRSRAPEKAASGSR